MATHSADEIAYINRLLHAMFATYNTVRMEVMAVDGKQALQVSRPPRREARPRVLATTKEAALKPRLIGA